MSGNWNPTRGTGYDVRSTTTPPEAASCSPVPQAWLRGQGVYLAGDYIHPRYPATLEAAVQSGQAAAAALLADWQQRPATEMKRL